MSTMSKEEIFDFLSAHKSEMLTRFGVKKIAIFGSVARGEHSDASDIDIAIEMIPEKKNLRNFLGFKRFVEQGIGKTVDLGIESALKPMVRDSIRKEIIYV